MSMKKTILVTGASRGIGAEIALLAAKSGYNVVLNYNKSEEKAQTLRQQILSLGADCIAVRADVSNSDEVRSMCAAAIAEFGSVDVLVNNAGVSSFALFTDITEELWDNTFDTNVKGAFIVTKEVLPCMIGNKSGRIINISSIWGITGSSCEVHYSATKAALIGMTKALAKELGLSGITVNCVAPGVIDTEMNAALDGQTLSALCDETPLGRIGTPQDVAKTVMFLASDDASFITGQVISPNGGIVI